jgi:hypothetical protein
MITAAEWPDAAREGLLTRYPLVFFIIAYAGTWLVELPYVRFAKLAESRDFRGPVPEF